MEWPIAGLALFLGVHVFSSLHTARGRLIAKLGEGGYKGIYSLLSLAGFGLIVAGMGKAPSVGLLLFGGFGPYSLCAMWSQNRRGARPSQTGRAVAGDIGASCRFALDLVTSYRNLIATNAAAPNSFPFFPPCPLCLCGEYYLMG